MRWNQPFGVLTVIILAIHSGSIQAQENNLSDALAKLQAVGPRGAGHQEAADAWLQVSKVGVEQLPDVLAGMDGANLLATNWIRAAVDTIASRALNNNQPLPVQQLESFLAENKHAPAARLTAYEWIARVDETAKQRLIPDKLDDASMELRYQAVEMAMALAAQQLEEGSKDLATTTYRKAFRSARNLKQAETIADALEKLSERPSLSTHFGFVMRWKLVGPFDNVDKKGFDVPYGPESNPSESSYPGKEGEVQWITHTTKDALGMVDLNTALARHKGAICYAYSEFISDSDRACELRLGCINANKVWLNGQLVFANHVYHSGRGMDQYRGTGQLKKGVNQILVKIAQNEQEEQWAQDWEFQLRVCDELGTGLLSSDRPAFKAAARTGVRSDQIGG